MRVVVTRSEFEAGELAARLEALGHDVVICPLIKIEPVGPRELDLSSYDWVVVTSRNGARELARRMRSRPRRVAAIGPGTAAALHEQGIEPDLVPGEATQEGLVAELRERYGHVLFAGAQDARRLLVDELQADFVPLYRTVELDSVRLPEADLVVLASASAARAYARHGAMMPVVSIGPQTTAAARELGVEVVAEAAPHDVSGLVDAVQRLAR
jgi:uroporphyrinogen-III synthase